MVFPEYGLTGLGVSEEEDRDRARQFMVTGQLGRNYCPQAMNEISENYNNNDEMLEMLACGAVEFKMYIVVNIGDVVDCSDDEVGLLTSTTKLFKLLRLCIGKLKRTAFKLSWASCH